MHRVFLYHDNTSSFISINVGIFQKMKDIFTCVDFNLNICSGDVTQESLPKKPVEELPKENV